MTSTAAPVPPALEVSVLGLVLLLLVLWLALSIVGAIVEGLLWLAVVGVLLFFATAAWGWMKRRTSP